MLAHHPVTGQPIRVLRSEAQITQSRRTLVWLQAGYSKSPRWQRWHILISDPAVWQGETLTGIIIPTFSEAWIPILKSVGDSAFVVYHRDAEAGLKAAGINTDDYISYRELFQMYPFLGEPVLPTDPIEKVVVSIAHILRFSYLAWTPSVGALENTGVKAQMNAWSKVCGGGNVQMLPADASAEMAIPACWLIQQYFTHPKPRRAREIAACLERNLENPYIDGVLLLNEVDEPALPTSTKLVTRVIGRRLTYFDVLDAIRNAPEIPANAFVVFANSDIWCDESLRVLWSIPMVERRLFLALLRWEADGRIFGPRPDSQDTWIVAKATVDFVPTEEEFGYPFGKPACDNAIAVDFLRKRCLVVNPAYSIKTHHMHESNIRDYNPRDALYKPMQLYLDPTPIQLFAVEEHMKAWEATRDHQELWRLAQPRETFTRTIHSVNETHLKTVCRAIADREGEEFHPNAPNTWTPPLGIRPLYEMRQGFVSDTGLLSNFQGIFVGNYDAWKTGWQDSTVSSVTTTIHVPTMISTTVPPTCWKSLPTWCLHYLPTALRIRKIVSTEYEFLVPTIPELPPFLYDCRWRDSHVGTIPHIPNTQYYCDKILAAAPVTRNQVTAEDVEILRELLPPAPKHSGTTIVICTNDIFTAGWVEEWQTCHAAVLRGARILTVGPKDSHRHRREAFQAASWIFGNSAALQWLWMARPGTNIVEWMLETAIASDIIHLAGAAKCKYILSFVRKEPVEFQRQHALLEFGKIWSEYAFQETVAATVETKPRIFIPAGKALSGSFVHQGDSFREMIRVWGEREYCTVTETEQSPHVWWGNVGQVLLYDRDTPQWWEPEKTNYQFALFGNCNPPGPEGHQLRQSVWSYWPRHPRLLEAAVEKGRREWANRSIESIFLGKVENGVQKARRNQHNWSAAVELFSMPEDTTGAPYPYSPAEYLAKLAETRFGLCLPGYGNKCHREIEYMALGVVPIVTPGVDMSHYLVPPKEGVHYLMAANPAEVRALISATTAEQWEALSNAGHTWWRQNASAEGLFRLTWGRIEQCLPLNGLILPPWTGR